MHIKDLIPEAGFVQRNYCDDCGKLLDLEFAMNVRSKPGRPCSPACE